MGLGVETLPPLPVLAFFIRTLHFYQRRMKEELLGEILRPVSRALGWIIAGALIMLFVYAVVVYVVPVIRRRLYDLRGD